MMFTKPFICILILPMTAHLGFSQSNNTTLINTTLASEQKIKGTQKLGFLIGDWETESWFYWNGKRPDKTEKGNYKAYYTLNKAFVTDDIQARHNGKDYLGKGFHSYNPQTQHYETWYFDSDGIVVFYPGGYWEDDSTLVFKGKDVNPSKIVEKRTYFKINSPDSFDLIEKQDYGDGNGFVTVLEVKYKRIQAK